MNPLSLLRKRPRLRYTLFVSLLLIAWGLGYWFGATGTVSSPDAPQAIGQSATTSAAEQSQSWTCSMHPFIHATKPGKCPICGMDLVPVTTTTATANPHQYVTSASAVALMQIQTSPVERRFVTADVRAVGKIDYDETRLANISAWVPGRIDRLYVDYTGIEVKKGDHMVSLYSPDVIAAAEELRRSASAVSTLRDTAPDVIRQTAQATLEATRNKLRRWGLTDDQIAQAERSGTMSDHITIYAPVSGTVIERNGKEGMYVDTGMMIYSIADLSRVWVKLQVYESDLAWIRYGQSVTFTAEAYPGQAFEGRVAFISPTLDDMTRTVSVRINAPNPDGRLKPGMFVRAVVHSQVAADGHVMDPDLAGKWICPMHPEVIKSAAGACDICGMALVRAEALGYVSASQDAREKPLVIPVSAALVTGPRAVVYVQLPNTERPTFEGREVVLGPRAGDSYIVDSGLSEGEQVVTNGAFKIDSAVQIQAKPSMMSPESAPAAASTASTGEAVTPQPASPNTPAAFQAQLRAVIDAYVPIHEALAADDLPGSQKAVSLLHDALGKVNMALLQGEDHMAWMDDLGAINRALDALGTADTLASARIAFSTLSNALIASGNRFGLGAGQEIYRLHCPMAFDAKGADWLQSNRTVRNPYYGPAMLTCGEVTGALSPSEGTAGE